jgi:hypothetical protein
MMDQIEEEGGNNNAMNTIVPGGSGLENTA